MIILGAPGVKGGFSVGRTGGRDRTEAWVDWAPSEAGTLAVWPQAGLTWRGSPHWQELRPGPRALEVPDPGHHDRHSTYQSRIQLLLVAWPSLSLVYAHWQVTPLLDSPTSTCQRVACTVVVPVDNKN